MKKILFAIAFCLIVLHAITLLISGCAQIGMPTGGVKDTIPPRLVKASPSLNSISFNSNKITLSFDEYIELQDIQSNLLFSPAPKNNPVVNSNLRTVSIRLKDSLQPNTTYRIDFGNAIKDINEGNVLRDFSYTFSTGTHIDSLSISGKVNIAETGKTDSTMLVYLYRNAPDSAITSRKPDYIAKVKGDGTFIFTNLPNDRFNIYALKDGDGNKFYNSNSEAFAFYEEPVNSSNAGKIELFAFAVKKNAAAPSAVTTADKDKRLKYATNLIAGKQDLLKPLELSFNATLTTMTSDSLMLCDTAYRKINAATITLDSTRNKISIDNKWNPEGFYTLLMYKGGLKDSSGITLAKNDTLRFQVKANSEYGSLQLEFKSLEISQHPILQFIDNDLVKASYPIPASGKWKIAQILPGDYTIRVLYDRNQNGIWDPGDYEKKLQPERSVNIAMKITVKADWENEINIDL